MIVPVVLLCLIAVPALVAVINPDFIDHDQISLDHANWLVTENWHKNLVDLTHVWRT